MTQSILSKCPHFPLRVSACRLVAVWGPFQKAVAFSLSNRRYPKWNWQERCICVCSRFDISIKACDVPPHFDLRVNMVYTPQSGTVSSFKDHACHDFVESCMIRSFFCSSSVWYSHATIFGIQHLRTDRQTDRQMYQVNGNSAIHLRCDAIRFLHNFGTYLPKYTASHPRRPQNINVCGF